MAKERFVFDVVFSSWKEKKNGRHISLNGVSTGKLSLRLILVISIKIKSECLAEMLISLNFIKCT